MIMRPKSKPLVIGGAIATAGMLAAASFAIVNATPSGDVRICHATASSENPYTVNTVNTSSVDEQGNKFLNGHGTHIGPIFDPEGGKDQPAWGDIIPPIVSPTNSANNFPGLNWSAAGQAIWANDCKIPTPTPTPTPTPEPTPTPTPTPEPTPESTPTPVTPTSEPEVPVAIAGEPAPEDQPVEVGIADPGAVPGEAPQEAEVEIAGAPVPTSVPAGKGAARDKQ
jgi:outer membrane biosynthesis protein TonB